jgi:hypothetical protein
VTRCVLLAVVLTCSHATTARAGWVAFDYAVAGPDRVGIAYGTRLTELGLSYGMPMSGRVGYDPSVPGVWSPDPTTGGKSQVLRYSSPGSFTLDVGGHTFASDAPLQIEWRDPNPFFWTGMLSIQAAPASGPYSPLNPGSQLYLAFSPWSATTWGSETMVPDLSLFAESSKEVALLLAGADPGDYYAREVFLNGFVTDLTPETGVAATPEPGTLTLAALGLGFGWRRGKRLPR